MSVNGVSASPLLARAILGDQTRVPIGAPVITNQKSKNSQDIQALITGTDLTEPLLNQFETFAEDGKEVFRKDNGDRLDFRERTNTNDKLVVEFAFDPVSGSLVMVRRNKQEERIFGFMRQSDFGVGGTGPRGLPGNDGKDGFEGRAGKDGDVGCPGKEGTPGKPGETGNEAQPGLIGITGPEGCEGSTGDRGVMGREGRPGFEGSRGMLGAECLPSSVGADGAVGAAFGRGVLFGVAAMSDPLAAVVGLDDDGIDAPSPGPCGWDGICPQPDPVIPPVIIPPPVVPPPTSVPVVPPPPVTASPSVSLCTDMPYSPKNSCGGNTTVWYTCHCNDMLDASIGFRGLSGLTKASSNTKAIPHSYVLCGKLAKGATYTFELTTPPGVASSLFLNCVIAAQTDYPGGMMRGTFTTTDATEIRLRWLNNQERIPTWCALKIFNTATGQLLYYTGQGAFNLGLSGANAALMADKHWSGNTSIQHY